MIEKEVITAIEYPGNIHHIFDCIETFSVWANENTPKHASINTNIKTIQWSDKGGKLHVISFKKEIMKCKAE